MTRPEGSIDPVSIGPVSISEMSAGVSTAAVGALTTRVLDDVLRSLGIAPAPGGRLLAVATDDYLRHELRAINAAALASGRPWLLAKPRGGLLWLGPLFTPRRGPCWECLAQRLRANRPVDALLGAGRADVVPLSRGHSPATLAIGWNLLAAEASRWSAERGLPGREASLLTLDTRTWTAREHPVVRRPQCPACGEARADAPRAVRLERRAKRYTHDGGHRAVGPETTLARFGHHVSPLTGAVTMLEPLPLGDGGVVHVYRSHHNVVVPQTSVDGLRGELRGGCAGKGASDLQARASGLCEALERYSSMFTGDEPRRRTRLIDLGGAAIHPNECLLYSERQHRERDRWNARRSHFCRVPPPFDPEAVVDWSPVWSLTRREPRWLPTAFCYFGHPEGDAYPQTSNGHSAGNTVEEAVLQGLLELIERDGCALWWYSRVQRPAVDLHSFDDPYVRQVEQLLAGRGRSLWVLDLTSDLGVPIFAALSRREGGRAERILLGFGAHLDPRIALRRAISELTQMLSWMLRGEREIDVDESEMAPVTARWLREAALADEPYLAPRPGPPVTAASIARRFTDDIAEDVRLLQARIEERGIELLVLDLTRPDVGLPAVKVIAPGLRPFWARLAPGRLYQVPVELGWLPRPLAEEDLNPTPMFL